MGLGKWWLKHGPGSPGAIAKAVTKQYIKIKNIYPSASKDEILHLLLNDRINSENLFGIKPINNDEQIAIIRDCDGSLKKLIVYIVHRENPEADNTAVNFPDIYRNMLQVINEAVDKQLTLYRR
jgi:hypothetical protein